MKAFVVVALLALMGVSQAARCDGTPGSADRRCCFACEIIVNELLAEDFTNHIHNGNDAKAALERACDRVGSHFEDAATCKMWVDANYLAIYTFVDSAVKNHTRPQARTICTQINECPAQRTAQRKVEEKGLACTACEILMNLVKEKLPEGGQATEAEVDKIIREECGHLGAVFGAFCDEIVEALLKKAIDEIIAEGNKLDAHTICHKAGLC